ncbi:MAG: hypothetical protein ACLQQ4_01255 [Bacteroidia bacterium]
MTIQNYNGTGAGTATGNPWTIIGCRGSFVLNGIILCQNDTGIGGTWTLKEPDSLGILTDSTTTWTIAHNNVYIVQG